MVLRVVNTAENASESLYFGYGSNLWKAQMRKRCPDSTYQGIARLNGYRWIINDRGYANVVQIATTKDSNTLEHRVSDNDEDVVWGLVYTLTPTDEAKLDVNEGVPVAYTKEDLVVDYWPARPNNNNRSNKPNLDEKPIRTAMLVYIDRQRTEPDVPKREYVYRMNMGIRDASGEGMPESYVEGVMREFIPEDGEEDGGEEVRRLARKQAERFEDEE